jgi:hypothetical protein
MTVARQSMQAIALNPQSDRFYSNPGAYLLEAPVSRHLDFTRAIDKPARAGPCHNRGGALEKWEIRRRKARLREGGGSGDLRKLLKLKICK